MNRKRIYNDYKIVFHADDKLEMKSLKNEVKRLKRKYEDICTKYDAIQQKHLSLSDSYKRVMPTTHAIHNMINIFNNDQLDEILHYKLMKAVLNKIKVHN